MGINDKGRLGTSRKFIKGFTHHNATGEFEVIERYRGEDTKPWLSIKWLTGKRAGQVEHHKEENINSTLYRYRVSRGMQNVGDTKGQTIQDLVETVDRIERMLKVVVDRLNRGK